MTLEPSSRARRRQEATSPRERDVDVRALAYFLFACMLIGFEIYLGFFRHPDILRTEGERPFPVYDFGSGAIVSGAFLMQRDGLQAVSIRLVADRPSSLRMVCKLLRLYDRDVDAENNPNVYTEIYRWTDTVRIRAGERWQRIEFPSVGKSDGEWYRFEIRLLDATSLSTGAQPQTRPTVGIIASEDNPVHGGKLWIEGVRQPGSLFFRAYGGTPYEQFRLLEPFFPMVLRGPAVQMALVFVYHGFFLILAYRALTVDKTTSNRTVAVVNQSPALARSSKGRSAVARRAGGSRDALLAAAVAVAVFLSLCGHFIAAGSPDAAIPLVPECLLFVVLTFGIAVWVRTRGDSEQQLPIARSERLFLVAIVSVLAFWTFPRVAGGLLSVGDNPCWLAAPSSISRAECFLQAGFDQGYGVRSFAALILALSVGAASAFWTRAGTRNWRALAFAVIGVCMLHAALGFVGVLSGQTQLLPKWLMVNSWGRDRFTFVMPNPSWVWPQLAPGLGWMLWFALSVPRRQRLLPIAGAVVLSAAIVSTRQRGGLLLLVLLWGCAAALWTWRRPRSTAVTTATRLVRLSGLLLCYFVVAGALVAWLFPKSFVPIPGREYAFQDQFRPRMWSVALNALVDREALWGFGYASWDSAFKNIVAGTTDARLGFGTAHNFWVQLVFEHGVVGFLVIASLILLTVWMAFENVETKPRGRELVALQLVAFLVCSMVQEVDYARPVLTGFAVTWGTLLGMPSRRSSARADAHPLVFSSRGTSYRVALALGVCSLTAAVAAVAWFARGAFAFERDFDNRSRLVRWLGAEATIPVFGPGKFWLFETRLADQQGSIALATADGTPLRLTVKRDEHALLPLTAGSRFVPERHRLRASPAVDEGMHQHAASVFYPPYAASDLLPVLLASNASPPVTKDGTSWIECAGSCQLALAVDLLDGFAPVLEVIGGARSTASDGDILWGVRLEHANDVSLPVDPFAARHFDMSDRLSNAGGRRPILTGDAIRSSHARWILLAVDKPTLSSTDMRVVRIGLMPEKLHAPATSTRARAEGR